MKISACRCRKLLGEIREGEAVFSLVYWRHKIINALPGEYGVPKITRAVQRAALVWVCNLESFAVITHQTFNLIEAYYELKQTKDWFDGYNFCL
jgi:hypothetical protein